MHPLSTALLVLIVSNSVLYHLLLKPRLRVLGLGRQIENRGNAQCHNVPALQACEKIILHQPTGLLYLACSTPSSRTHWTPALLNFDTEGMSQEDYVAVYNPDSAQVTRLHFQGYDFRRDLSLHGMDVVPSLSNPDELFVYLVNHRRPPNGLDPAVHGADSSIEIFKTSVGSSTLTHVSTVEDPVIQTPNDIVGSPTGQSFYFTNDHGSKTGYTRHLEAFLGWSLASVGFCEVGRGCKFAAKGLPGANGITRAMNDTYYIASSSAPELRVLERQRDDTLLVKDVIPMDRLTDNISLDQDGTLWAAGFPNVFRTRFRHFTNPSVKTPSSAHRVSVADSQKCLKRRYRVEKTFEDDGTLASGITSVAHDSRRSRLFLHGFAASHLTICTSPTSA